MRWLSFVFVAIVAILPSIGSAQDPADLKRQIEGLQKQLQNLEEVQTEKTAFLRIDRDDRGRAISLDTAIVRYKNSKGIIVDLVGAVHVGEERYYSSLNKQFKEYDVLLYELVADKGVRPERKKREVEIDPENPLSAIGSMQGMMTQVLGLQHQMEGVDYSPENFLHADLSPADLQKRMEDRGESPMVLALEQMASMMKQQNVQEKNPRKVRAEDVIEDEELLFGILQGVLTGKPSPVVKRYMALQFDDLEQQSKMFGGGVGRLILDDRNAACFETLDEQLKTGKKTIGIFYGAAHLPDMEKRLVDRGFKRDKSMWLEAWDIR